MSDEQFAVEPGVIFVTTYGSVTVETTQSLVLLTRHIERQGLNNIDIRLVVNTLVDKARNECVQQMLNTPAKWMLFIDADMDFKPEILNVLLETAFNSCKWADIVGGYCCLRGWPYMPTMDTGTGTWEPWEYNIGPREVMRTGAACMLIKRHVLERMEQPWFGVRPIPRPLDIMYEFDNYCNQKLDGRNPFRKLPEWDALEHAAAEESGKPPLSTVGEDSGFCDRAKALGFRIVVQTNATLGHVSRQVITGDDHTKAMKEQRDNENLACGVLPL